LSVHTGVSGPAERRKTRPLLRAGREPAFMSGQAAVRWVLLLLVGLVDCIWMRWAGFHIGPGVVQSIGFISLLILISIIYFYTGRDERIMHFAHFGAQYLTLFAVLTVLSYLAVSTNAPLVDDAFDAIDKAMGLDWLAWTKWLTEHPTLGSALFVVYGSLPAQQIFCYVRNVHMRTDWRNTEIWWITFFSASVTIAGSAVFPASNPYVYYGLEKADHFLHMVYFLGLRDGTIHVIGFADAQGLVQLPSFHTILAITLTYNLRHNRWLFSAALLWNTALILSCPTEGSHYFIDLVAGAAVAAATIWGVRAKQRRFQFML
jgi:PAP2 superfamily